MGYLYRMVDKESETSYPSYANVGGGEGEIHPNAITFIGAVNRSQPIIKCQYEVVFSRWPRTIFFAKDVTIPGLTVNTIDINHAGFTIPIATHVYYETTEVTMNILADKEGYHYYDFRNFVMQSGHPLVAGDTLATIGNNFNINQFAYDTIDIKLRNQPTDKIYHHWTICNFRPTGLGDLELGHEDESFAEFEVTGTFTHIFYDCGLGFDEIPINTRPTEQDEKDEEVPHHTKIVDIPSTNSDDNDSSNNDSSNGQGDSTNGQGDSTNGQGDSTNGQGDSTNGADSSSDSTDSTNGGNDSTGGNPDSTEGSDSSKPNSSPDSSPDSSTDSSTDSSEDSSPDSSASSSSSGGGEQPPNPQTNVDEITLRNIDTSLQWSGNLPIDATVVNMLRLKNPEGTPLTDRELELARNCQEQLEKAGKDFIAALSKIRDTMEPDPNYTTKFVTRVLGGSLQTPRPTSDGNNDLVRNQIVVRVGISSQDQQDAFDIAIRNYLSTAEAIKRQYLEQLTGSRGVSRRRRKMPDAFKIFDLQAKNVQDIEEIEEPSFKLVDNIPQSYLAQARFSEFKWKGNVVKPRKPVEATLDPEVENLVGNYWQFQDCNQISFVYSYPQKVNTSTSKSTFSPIVCVSLMKAPRQRSKMEQALAKAFLRKANYETMKLLNGVQNLVEIPRDDSYAPTQLEVPVLVAMYVPIRGQASPDFDKIEVGGTIECTIYSERQNQYILGLVQQAQGKLDDILMEYYSMKYNLTKYEFGETADDAPSTPKLVASEELENIQTLAKAIRYNHDITDAQTIDMSVDHESELENFNLKITQLTLPHRFGMYREQRRGVPVKTPVKVEEPEPDEFQERDADLEQLEELGIKIRRIFD